MASLTAIHNQAKTTWIRSTWLQYVLLFIRLMTIFVWAALSRMAACNPVAASVSIFMTFSVKVHMLMSISQVMEPEKMTELTLYW